VPKVQSYVEDLLQPWYYLYLFRTPRYVHDPRGLMTRSDLERLGLAPRGGWRELGFGTTILGMHGVAGQGCLGGVSDRSVSRCGELGQGTPRGSVLGGHRVRHPAARRWVLFVSHPESGDSCPRPFRPYAT
jgi:hypothetical protein